MTEPLLNTESLRTPNIRKETVVNKGLLNEWKIQHISEGHSLPSTLTYYSFIKKYVGSGKVISQKTINIFRKDNMSCVASSAIKCFFRFLVDKKEYPDWILNLRFGKSKTVKKQPEGITVSEVEKLLNNMEALKDRYLTLLLFELGLRLSEGLNLLWSDFNWDEWLKNKEEWGVAKLRNTKGGKFRVVPVPPGLMAGLYDNHKNRNSDGIPIGGHVCDYGFLDYVKYNNYDGNGKYIPESKIAKQKRVQEEKYKYIIYAECRYRGLLYTVSREVLGRRINPHRLRHAKAQSLMDEGLGIEYLKSFLGHASISSTEVYAQASPTLLMRELKKIKNKKQDI